MNKLLTSKPRLAVDVTLFVNTTGPVNSDIALPSSPPSTRIDCVNVPSVALTKLISVRFDISSPVTVLTGESNRGTITNDTYTLKGFTAAINKLNEEC